MMIARLIGCSPKPRQLDLSGENLPATIGRGPANALRLNDRWTSRRHCELKLVEGVVWVFDLESTHGTYVNGRRVHAAPLANDDQLHVGLSAFRVAYERPTVEYGGQNGVSTEPLGETRRPTSAAIAGPMTAPAGVASAVTLA